MSRYCYSKLKNTWLSDHRQHTSSYTDPTPSYKINSYTDPTSKGLVVFDIDDTLRVVDLQKYADCQWRTTKCGFPNNTLADTQTRAVKAINTFYAVGYDIAIYTREQNSELNPTGGKGALPYVTGLASKIDPLYKTKFTQDILVNYETNIMFGTSSKYGPNKGQGLIKLADRLNIPHNKVVMFDDGNDNINDITQNGFCGITVSNTPYTCGISEKNLSDGVNFMYSGQCPTVIPNPSTSMGACAPPCTKYQPCTIITDTVADSSRTTLNGPPQWFVPVDFSAEQDLKNKQIQGTVVPGSVFVDMNEGPMVAYKWYMNS